MKINTLLDVLVPSMQPSMGGFVHKLESNLKHWVAWAIMNQAK